MKNVRAKKSLGQHFLNDEHIARRIAETIAASQLPESAKQWGDTPVLEIGPGMGMLTKYLIETGRDLTAVELDSESVAFLSKMYPDLKVEEADFLRMDLNDLFPGQEFTVIGNYPYNISSQIFSKFWRTRNAFLWRPGCCRKKLPSEYARAKGDASAEFYRCFCRHGTTANIFSPSSLTSSLHRRKCAAASCDSPETPDLIWDATPVRSKP